MDGAPCVFPSSKSGFIWPAEKGGPEIGSPLG